MSDMPFCQWYNDDVGGDSIWQTECKKEFYFDDSSRPDENSFKFCPFCGKGLTIVLRSEEQNP